jgi:hypothetical protein
MEHFTTPSASNGRLFLATDSMLSAYTIATPLIPAPPVPTPSPTPILPPAKLPTCRVKVAVRLRVPRHERITRVTVYIGHRRVLRRHGAHLRRIGLAHLGKGKVTLRVVETPRHGKRFTLTVHVRNCRVSLPKRRVRA